MAQSKLFLIMSILFSLSVAHAFEIDRMVVELSPSGENSKAQIKIKNNEAHQRVINVDFSERVFSGRSESQKATEKLTVDNKSLMIEPGKESTVTIEWKGKADIKSSEAFRVVFTELRKNKEKVNSLKEPLISYHTSVFVSPETATEKVDIQKAEIQENSRKLLLTLKNSGKKHRLFMKTGLEIKDLKSKEVLTVIQDSPELQQVLLMPGQVKTIEIPLNQEVKKKPILVSFKEHESTK